MKRENAVKTFFYPSILSDLTFCVGKRVLWRVECARGEKKEKGGRRKEEMLYVGIRFGIRHVLDTQFQSTEFLSTPKD